VRKPLVIGIATAVAAGGLAVAVSLRPSQVVTAGNGTNPPPAASSPTSAPVMTRAPEVPEDTGGHELGAFVSKMSQWLDIPPRAVAGYAKATRTLGREQPSCHLSWITLAAIGKTATDHGRATGARFGADGHASKPIGTVELKDFYGDVVSVKDAVGPMQLSPDLWRQWQRSASGGKPDQQNVDDAALTTGRALCAGDRDLSQGEAWWTAVSTLQPATLFLHRTLATTNVYGTVGLGQSPPNPAVLAAVNFVIGKIGLPYVWGGNGTGGADPGFDCSGLTTAAYASAGVPLKRTADAQFRSVTAAPPGTEPQLGDLIFYGVPATKIHHVGLYIGNQQMVDAPTEGQAVQVHDYRTPGDDYAGAGRPTN
jgi:cell wall-associated NlpC family hydrolase